MAAILAFFKGVKLDVVAFLLLAVIAAGAIAYGAWMRHSLKAVEAEVVLEQAKRQTAEQQLADAQEQYDKRLNSIKVLEIARKNNRLEIEPFVLRLDELTRKDDNAPNSSFVDSLNSLNADTNRMLEQNSR